MEKDKLLLANIKVNLEAIEARLPFFDRAIDKIKKNISFFIKMGIAFYLLIIMLWVLFGSINFIIASILVGATFLTTIFPCKSFYLACIIKKITSQVDLFNSCQETYDLLVSGKSIWVKEVRVEALGIELIQNMTEEGSRNMLTEDLLNQAESLVRTFYEMEKYLRRKGFV